MVGTGAGGLATALRAADNGLRVTVVEALDRVGGATAFSGGQVWAGANHLIEQSDQADSVEDALAYVTEVAGEDDQLDPAIARRWVEAAPRMLRWLERDARAIKWAPIPGYPDYYYPTATGSRPSGRYLTAAPFEGSRLGPERERLLVSPHFPVGITYEELFELSPDKERIAALVAERREHDLLTFGTGIAAHLFEALLERQVPILLEHRAAELLNEDGRVTGLVCENGRRLRGAVLLATGAYDWDADLARRFSQLDGELYGSVAPPTLRGDGVKLAESVGARVAAMAPQYAPHVAGYRSTLRGPYDAGFRTCAEIALPHSFIVNRAGHRFCDDAFYKAVGEAALAEPQRNLPFFLIWDYTHHRRYGLGAVPPGAEYPEAIGVKSAATLPELARELGIDGAELQRTADHFNRNSREGTDPDFGRGMNRSVMRFRGDPRHQPNGQLGPVETAPFFGLRMNLMNTAIGAGGVLINRDGAVLSQQEEPIPGLYAAGCTTAATSSGTGYNSGYSISRSITFGCLAADDLTRRLGRT